MMTNLTVPSQSSQDATEASMKMSNETRFLIYLYIRHQCMIFSPFLLLICFFGLVGNGTVIWLLGFRIKRNPFTTYILNLAVADFGVLITVALLAIWMTLFALEVYIFWYVVFLLAGSYIFSVMYNTGQLLLTTISIDRCVAVLFPIWHRCHRPSKLSTTVCALIWVLSFMLCGITMVVLLSSKDRRFLVIVNLLYVLICHPVMATCTLTMFVKIGYTQHNRKRTKSLTVILLTLLFFLIFGSPMSFYNVITYYYFFVVNDDSSVSNPLSADSILIFFHEFGLVWMLALLCASLNSSVNPVLYFLAGREKSVRSRVPSMKVALRRVFSDEEDHREDEEPQAQTQL